MDLITKSKTYHLNERTHIMGILNVTPDSFSDGGNYNSIEKAVLQAKKMEEAGADIIDIGGESTRPDHEPIDVEEEIKRVVPIIKALKEEINIPISIDTYKAETAKQAIESGAEIINDIWGAKHDPEMADVAATYEVPIILMHNRTNKKYEALIEDMVTDLQDSIDIVKRAGVKDKNIILDPGVGFGKELEDNYVVMRHLDKFIERLPYPLLLATSRKSFISKVLDVPPKDRDNATGATTCMGILKGAHIVRVHDVKRTVELAKMMDAMVKGVGISG
ncbi:dihydropteroate synthase [Pseudogracilibacillus sp. SO30301A]|uniref:dihydropteroate synthase n=1 Tax=Pseudogracilibacillus sp. SO30301A TaxID=3098291 RepID=UPI00300DC48A